MVYTDDESRPCGLEVLMLVLLRIDAVSLGV
jgi:hypothetical protein